METSKVKILYENELDDAKKLIEELAHEKSRLEIELEKSRSEMNEIVTKSNEKSKISLNSNVFSSFSERHAANETLELSNLV